MLWKAQGNFSRLKLRRPAFIGCAHTQPHAVAATYDEDLITQTGNGARRSGNPRTRWGFRTGRGPNQVPAARIANCLCVCMGRA